MTESGDKVEIEGFSVETSLGGSQDVRRDLVEATFLPVLDYGDLLYMNASVHCLHMLDIVYHGALRFVTNYRALTHHCILYSKVTLACSVNMLAYSHWYVFIYKAILGRLPCYLSVFLTRKHGNYGLRSQDTMLMTVPRVRTELGKKAFMFSAPFAWNSLQNELKLQDLVTLNEFKGMVKSIETDSIDN